MRVVISKQNILKLALIAVFVGIATLMSLLSEQQANASASGPSPSFTDAPGETNCTACHVDFPVNSGTGSIQITGVPQSYLPGQQIQITITTIQEDGVNYGFQLTAVDEFGRPAGTWTLQDVIQTQIVAGFVGPNLRQYVEHTFEGIVPTTFGSKSWSVLWTAPTRRLSKVSFHAAGNAANGNGTTSGDFIYTTAETSSNGTAVPDDLVKF
ncbi:MAG: choice-of-anchor V domain-containing protein [Pyrinomonadaceae bacterium]